MTRLERRQIVAGQAPVSFRANGCRRDDDAFALLSGETYGPSMNSARLHGTYGLDRVEPCRSRLFGLLPRRAHGDRAGAAPAGVVTIANGLGVQVGSRT